MSKQQFALDDYNDVAARIAEFREKHPDGSLQQIALDFREVNGGWWVIYTAAAYRHPDDLRPGQGTAWEPIPGRTPYTKDSEVQNAETAAWGRAIVAVLAADTKKGIASAQEAKTTTLVPQAQALADLAPNVQTVDALKKQVYDAAKSKELFGVPVTDPVTGDMTTLGRVISDAKARLEQMEKKP